MAEYMRYLNLPNDQIQILVYRAYRWLNYVKWVWYYLAAGVNLVKWQEDHGWPVEAAVA